MFNNICNIIVDVTKGKVKTKLWARMPSFYIEEKYVRLIPFKDHINIEASAIVDYKNKLSAYKISSKGMLKIYMNQSIPEEILRMVIIDSILN